MQAHPERPFDLRLMSDSDLPELLELYRQCEDFLALGPNPTASEAMVLADLDLLRHEGGRFCGIYPKPGELAGVLDYLPFGFGGRRDAALLNLLMLAPAWRGQGLGEAVVAWLENQLRADPQLRVIEAGVQVNNPGAIRFWQARGFRIVSGPEPQLDGTTSYHLVKPL